MGNRKTAPRRRQPDGLEEVAASDWADQSYGQRAESLGLLGFGPGTMGSGSEWADLPVQVREAVLEDIEGGGF